MRTDALVSLSQSEAGGWSILVGVAVGAFVLVVGSALLRLVPDLTYGRFNVGAVVVALFLFIPVWVLLDAVGRDPNEIGAAMSAAIVLFGVERSLPSD